MSRAIALIRFKDGMILRCCYNGTSDWLKSWLITDERLRNDYNSSIFACDDSDYQNSLQCDNVTDEEVVEIFSDYGSGFTWTGKASKSCMCITEGRNIDYVDNWSRNMPEWVINYFKEKGWDYNHLIR